MHVQEKSSQVTLRKVPAESVTIEQTAVALHALHAFLITFCHVDESVLATTIEQMQELSRFCKHQHEQDHKRSLAALGRGFPINAPFVYHKISWLLSVLSPFCYTSILHTLCGGGVWKILRLAYVVLTLRDQKRYMQEENVPSLVQIWSATYLFSISSDEEEQHFPSSTCWLFDIVNNQGPSRMSRVSYVFSLRFNSAWTTCSESSLS